MKRLFWLLALLALPVFVMTSCKEDEEGPTPDEDEVITYIDGVSYLHEHLYGPMDGGSAIRPIFGKFINESEPTVLYVRTQSMKEAKAYFHMLLPVDADIITAGDNETGILTDKNHNETGRIYFTANGEDGSYGRVTFSKGANVPSSLTAIVYMPVELWPENAVGDTDDCPLKAGCIYTRNNTAYLCTRTATDDEYGFIWTIEDNVCFCVNMRSRIDDNVGSCPRLDIFTMMAADFNNSGDRYYKLMAAICNKTASDIKGRRFYTQDCSVSMGYVWIYNMNTEEQWKYEPISGQSHWVQFKDSDYHWKSAAYVVFKSDDKWKVVRDERRCVNPESLDINEFKLDEALMRKADSITN